MIAKKHLRVVYDDDFYQAMRRKLRAWAGGKGRGYRFLDLILLAPDLLHLMARLTLDKRVPFKSKLKLAAAIAYFVSPFDLLPEAVLGPAGYLDDMALAAWVIDDLIRSAGPELVLDHWAGDADLLEVLAKIISAADELIGSGLVRKLRNIVDRQEFMPKMLEPAGQGRDLPDNNQ